MKSSGMRVAALLLGTFLFGHAALAASLQDYFGTYVGVAEAENLEAGTTEQRDIEFVISPYKKKGFQVAWVTVILVDGRRDLPGVRRKTNRVLFLPGKGKCCFVQVDEYDPFREREPKKVIEGEPLRWALLDDDALHIYSFAVTEEGGYELQSYNRRLTADGMELRYERIEDGVVRRRITGHAVRVAEER